MKLSHHITSRFLLRHSVVMQKIYEVKLPSVSIRQFRAQTLYLVHQSRTFSKESRWLRDPCCLPMSSLVFGSKLSQDTASMSR